VFFSLSDKKLKKGKFCALKKQNVKFKILKKKWVLKKKAQIKAQIEAQTKAQIKAQMKAQMKAKQISKKCLPKPLE